MDTNTVLDRIAPIAQEAVAQTILLGQVETAIGAVLAFVCAGLVCMAWKKNRDDEYMGIMTSYDFPWQIVAALVVGLTSLVMLGCGISTWIAPIPSLLSSK